MSVASLEDSEEPFLTLSQQIASSFVDIYLSQGAEARKEVVPKYVAKSPFGKNGKLVSDGPGAGSEEEAAPQHTEQPAVQVAKRLAEIGDAIDAKVQKEMREVTAEFFTQGSVFDVRVDQFKTMCRRILSNCSGVIQNGWQQVWVVHAEAGEITRQIRQESHEEHSQRETQVAGYVGQFIQDVGLDQWTTADGSVRDANYPAVEITEDSPDERGTQ